MTDDALIEKKLAFIETCVAQLRSLARPEVIATDVREQRFVEHTLQVSIQAALDIASHVVSDARLGEPRTNRELFDLLHVAKWLPDALLEPLRRMAGFRNIIVHGYGDVDLGIVKDVVEHHLGDLLAFVTAIRARLTPPAP